MARPSNQEQPAQAHRRRLSERDLPSVHRHLPRRRPPREEQEQAAPQEGHSEPDESGVGAGGEGVDGGALAGRARAQGAGEMRMIHPSVLRCSISLSLTRSAAQGSGVERRDAVSAHLEPLHENESVHERPEDSRSAGERKGSGAVRG